MSWVRRMATNFGLIAVSIILTVVLLEIFLRFTRYKSFLIFYDFPRYYFRADPVKGFDIQENFRKSDANVGSELKYKVWSNELGCFDRPYNNEKEYILLVGDSFTHARSPFQDKWGTQIESFLGYRVIKGGVGGYGTKQELLKAKEIISKINHPPKLIILGYYMNDLEDDYLFPSRTVIEGYRVDAKKLKNKNTGEILIKDNNLLKEQFKLWEYFGITKYPRHPFFKKIGWLLKQNSVIYNLAESFSKRFNFKTKKNIYIHLSFKNYPWIKYAWGKHLQNLKNLKELADNVGSELLVVVIPSKTQVYKFLSTDLQNIDLEKPNKILHEFFKKEGINYFDLLPLMRKFADQTPRKKLNPQRDFYWQYDEHWSINGNRLGGFLVSKYILGNNILNIEDKEKRLRIVDKGMENFN